MDIMGLRSVGYRARLDGKAIEELTSLQLIDHLPFSSRDEYLAWVVEWKKEYRELSEEIRSTKAKVKSLQKENHEDAGYEQSKLVFKGFDARMLLALRRASKSYSWALKGAAVQLAEGVFV